jgi:hypothetical protein
MAPSFSGMKPGKPLEVAMIRLRKAEDRGRARYGWLDSRHTFSFGRYFDRDHMGFGPLRVINDDRVAPGAGFGAHGHRDMEIISYVVDGAMEHRDSLGHGSVIRPGDVQRMSAGTGIEHSEFNHSPTAPLRFLQIWVIPERRGLAPGYEQTHFDAAERRGRFRIVASRDGRERSVTVHQDAAIYAGLFDAGESDALALRRGRAAWVQVVRGALEVNGERLEEGDGAALTAVPAVEIARGESADVLVFELPA